MFSRDPMASSERAARAGATGAARGRVPRCAAVAAYRRLLRCKRGSAAVEFGMIGALFLGILFLVLNTTLMFFAQQALQTATTEAARLIMTGQAQAQSMGATQFKQAICANAGSLLDCSGLSVNVATFNSFSAITMANPMQNGAFSNANFSYTLGNSGDIQVVQVFYQWPLFASLLGFDMSNAGAGFGLLVGTAAFRIEPFGLVP
jgi:Flp pilus assembly protein TadG